LIFSRSLAGNWGSGHAVFGLATYEILLAYKPRFYLLAVAV
jgi:hypothetical protein